MKAVKKSNLVKIKYNKAIKKSSQPVKETDTATSNQSPKKEYFSKLLAKLNIHVEHQEDKRESFAFAIRMENKEKKKVLLTCFQNTI